MARERARKWLLSLTILFVLSENGEGIWFHLPATGSKCLSEKIYADVIVFGNYYSFSSTRDDPAPTMAVEITSPLGNNLYHKENVTMGEFSFTTTEEGIYVACFRIDGNNSSEVLTVSLDWKTGIFTKDWESVARAEKIEGLELELRKLEERVKAIRKNIIGHMIREFKMQKVSTKTNARVARFSLMSMGVCILVSALQVWQLKRFFLKKKLV
ncbi:PREDICTED: transmembrane emp24 domain-containing protein p24delta4-like [Ipomoea nil]|uniref:transmembrane emp24 domain-containing protein p24delta4-like n=1 Tax=Ipomoea nil TaxID=35883 RepID=UPI000901DC7C|nr:PREDICTED: transmembrane emp24 domain-containing protein p24delta4-like [Ipomoea nil]